MRRKPKTAFGRNTMITARGIVIPADWDDDGNVTAVLISTHREDEYLVDSGSGKGGELLEAIRQEVEVSGMLRESARGRKAITVEAYRIV